LLYPGETTDDDHDQDSRGRRSGGPARYRGARVRETDRRRGRPPGRRPDPGRRGEGGNKDGTIPAWTGGLCAPPAGWTPAQGYVDPFASDKVLFTITKANAAQYKDKLTPGTLAMLDKYDNFKMNVYKTHRTACLPQDAYDVIKSMATKIDLQGFGFSGGFSYVPFPIPKNGMEAIWNHVPRYLGAVWCASSTLSRCAPTATTTRSRPRSDGCFFRTSTSQRTPAGRVMSRFLAPATLEAPCSWCTNRSTSVKETARRGSTTPAAPRGPRRPVLRQINDGTEGLRTTDQFDASTAAPDRYDWSSSARRNLRPYNAYKLSDKSSGTRKTSSARTRRMRT